MVGLIFSAEKTEKKQIYLINSGWYTKHYGAVTLEKKRPFQSKNTKKLDAIRDEIEKLNLEWEDKCVILICFLRFTNDSIATNFK